MLKNKSLYYHLPKIIIFKIVILIGLVVYFLKGKSQDGITIGFTGDVMLGRTVNEVMNNKGYKYVWGNALSLLKENDLNIINLETTLTNHKEAVPKVFNFKATPDKVKALSLAKIKVVNIANNHILDFGIPGMQETIQVLDKAKIMHVGAGMNESEAKKPVIITKKGIKIGIIGYTDNEPEWEAIGDKPGTNYVKVGNIQKIKNDIAALRDEVDVLILSIHWGPNKRQRPTKEFIDFAHAIIDSGIDIFHGHSAHVFQGIEIYNNKVIMYDTGDFVDDYAVTPELRNDQSFLFKVNITKEGIKSVKLIPTIISTMQVNKADAKESQAIIQKMQALSKEFNTEISDDGIIFINN